MNFFWNKKPEIKCQHKWRYVNVLPYNDSSYNAVCPSIYWTRACIKCNDVSHGHSYGSKATVEDLNTNLDMPKPCVHDYDFLGYNSEPPHKGTYSCAKCNYSFSASEGEAREIFKKEQKATT